MYDFYIKNTVNQLFIIQTEERELKKHINSITGDSQNISMSQAPLETDFINIIQAGCISVQQYEIVELIRALN